MAKQNRQATGQGGSGETPPLTKRYRSMPEIKRDFFPNAAAKEAHLGQDSHDYENLVEGFFGPQQKPSP